MSAFVFYSLSALLIMVFFFLGKRTKRILQENEKLEDKLKLVLEKLNILEKKTQEDFNIVRMHILKLAQGKPLTDREVRENMLYTSISNQKAYELIREKGDVLCVVDVRETFEFENGHIPGALNIPLSEIETRWREIPRDKENLLVICAAGRRSLDACNYLSREHEFLNLVNVEGGMTFWTYEIDRSKALHKSFTADMLVSDAFALHPRAREVFASFHLGGCSSCAISDQESIAQVTMNYGVPTEELLDILNSLLEGREVKVDLPPESDLTQNEGVSSSS
jgi:hybrid cluster-associated redox disulfide protein